MDVSGPHSASCCNLARFLFDIFADARLRFCISLIPFHTCSSSNNNRPEITFCMMYSTGCSRTRAGTNDVLGSKTNVSKISRFVNVSRGYAVSIFFLV